MFNIEECLSDCHLDGAAYEELLRDLDKKVHKETTMSWSEIAQKYNLPYSEDAIRKAQQLPLIGGSFVRQYYMQKGESGGSGTELNDEITLKMRELEIQKTKYRDERNAWVKQNRTTARADAFFELLKDEIKTIDPDDYDTGVYLEPKPVTMIVCLADWHIGECFNNWFGQYDTEVAESRVKELCCRVGELAKLYTVEKFIVVLLGDMISGNIHKNIQITNKEDVVKQIKVASQLVENVCLSLMQINGAEVELHSVSGNHTRMDKKSDALHDERLDELIPYIVNQSLHRFENFRWDAHLIDSGIDAFPVYGNNFMAVHGDMDATSVSGVAKLTSMAGFIPHVILKGHNHTPAFNEVNGIQVVQSGSLVGTGNQYTLENRLKGRASQTVLLCDENGIFSMSNIDLDRTHP